MAQITSSGLCQFCKSEDEFFDEEEEEDEGE